MVVLEEITNTFWGVTLTEGKRYAQTLEGIVHISMAAVEPGSTADDKAVSVLIHHRKSDFVLCSLNGTSILQQSLDLSFNQGEEVAFYLKGKGTVHLTGYVVPGDDYDSASDEDFKPQSSVIESEDDDEDDASSDEDVDLTKGSKKRKKDQVAKQPKKSRVEIVDDDDDDDDEENDESLSSEDDDEDGENDSEDDDEDEEESEMDDDDDDIEDEDDDDDDDQEDEIPKQKNTKKENKKPSASPAKQSKELKHNKEKETEKPEENVPSQSQSETNEKKKKKKKNKKKKNEATSAGSNSSPEKQAPSKSKVVEDVVIEDLKVGHGPEAKKGSTVHVYYTGKLPSGKLFDSTTGGKGFKFRLGKKEVIKGWEVGVEGMKVGGKRKLVIPPKMGYGSQKVGNSIPPNSTLHFEVELKAVS